MKNKISYFIVLLLSAMAVTFYACEDKDDYNYNNIEPIIFSIAGPDVATAHGVADFPSRYTVPERGGSTYNWQVGGHGGSIVQDETFPSIAYITFNQSSTNTTATITVTETTLGGKTSEPFTRSVSLQAFCPYNMSEWAGDYSGTMAGYHAPTVVLEPVVGLNLMKVKGLAYFVPNAWGEAWVKGDGSCIMEFSCGDVVTIKRQWIGDSDYPDVYGIMGSGTVDPVNKVINLSYHVYYSFTATGGTSAYGAINTVLTLDGKILSQSEIKPVGARNQ
jgi:hypothetical protein